MTNLPVRRRLARWLPILRWLPDYERSWLRADLGAGLAIAALLLPVGVAYAQAAGLPPIAGLYATIVPLMVYAAFGPSRVLVLGPDSALTALVLGVVVVHAHGDPARAMAIAAGMAIVSGVVCLVAGAARLGFVAELLSKPIRFGYLNGIALTMILSQLPVLLGIDVGRIMDPAGFRRFLHILLNAGWHLPTALLGSATLLFLLLLRRWPRFPAVLFAVVLSTVCVVVLDLAAAGVTLVGDLPAGLPQLSFPLLDASDLAAVLAGGVAVALVSVADTSVLSRTYALRLGQRVDPNQEMIGLGLANLATGFLQGFPVSSSSTRTPIAEAAGARTQLAGVVAALTVTLVLMLDSGLLISVPTSALAGVVIAAAISLAEVRGVVRIARLEPVEFGLSVVCSLGVVVLGVLQGIGLAIGVAVLAFLWQSWRPHWAVLGRVDDVSGYHDVSRHPEALRIPGLVLFRWDAPLFFANAELFAEQVNTLIDTARDPVRVFVVAAEPVTHVDLTAADMLDDLRQQLEARGIELAFAELKGPVKDHLRRLGVFDRFGAERFHVTLAQAVGAYLARHAEARPAASD
jgi:high affinity sulfate transporter 1